MGQVQDSTDEQEQRSIGVVVAIAGELVEDSIDSSSAEERVEPSVVEERQVLGCGEQRYHR